MAALRGLDGFKTLVKEFNGLSLIFIGGTVAVPFIAGLAGILPPWPPAITAVSAIFELVCLILVFQFLSSASKKQINRVILIGLTFLTIVGAAYLFFFSYFTLQPKGVDKRVVRGFECTKDAAEVFGDKCPNLGQAEIEWAENRPENLWTTGSITLVRLILVGLWLGALAGLCSLVSSFALYQMRTKT